MDKFDNFMDLRLWFFFGMGYDFFFQFKFFFKGSINLDEFMILNDDFLLIIVSFTGFVEYPPGLGNIAQSDHTICIVNINSLILAPFKQVLIDLLNGGYVPDQRSLNLNPQVIVLGD